MVKGEALMLNYLWSYIAVFNFFSLPLLSVSLFICQATLLPIKSSITGSPSFHTALMISDRTGERHSTACRMH